MIWLDSQLDDLPSILIYDILNKLLQTVMNWTHQNLPASFGTPNDMVDHQMDAMLFMDIVVFHVDSIRWGYVDCQQFHPTQVPNKGGPFIPALKRRGFLGRFR